MDTGCFVKLEDVRGGREGLVHVSQMASRRITNAKEVVKRDQEVFVKVVSVKGDKLSLSLRDVDQDTGKDLLPMQRGVEDAPRTKAVGAIGDGEYRGGSGRTLLAASPQADELTGEGGSEAANCFGCSRCEGLPTV